MKLIDIVQLTNSKFLNMYKLKLNNKLINFNPGTRVIDLIDKNEVKQYMVCKINQTIKELTYPLSEKHDNSEITLLTLEHKEAGRAYEATLRYIISMAFSNFFTSAGAQLLRYSSASQNWRLRFFVWQRPEHLFSSKDASSGAISLMIN